MTITLSPVPYEDLGSADLTVGRVYKGGTQAHVGADPLHYLTGVGNSGGFRTRNVPGTGAVALCVLFSTGVVREWPDGWNDEGGYVYFGDQRTPGRAVHDTPRKGNRLLSDIEMWTNRGARGRVNVPPFLLFEKDGPGRDVRFEGLLVPGSDRGWLTLEERATPEGVLSNYRATFKPLSVKQMERKWLSEVLAGNADGPDAPPEWTQWVETGEIS